MKFGKFELEKQLAIGGMAEVFVATQSGPAGFSKTLCLKRILPKLASDTTFVEMFLDEARTAALLNHPNIVQIYELGEIDNSFYIAMEYIRGASLSKLVRRLREKDLQVPLHYAAKIIADVCAGLDYAHNFADSDGRPLHLVHRDISPDNILVSTAGSVKMIDFGIAKAVTNTSKTQAGAVKGKFSYMSPEQVKGIALDARSDLFSLGIVFYEFITCRKPFGDDADLMTVSAIVHDAPRSPRECLDDFPTELEVILEKMLAKEPAQRYQSASALHRDLEKFIRDRGDFVSDRDIGNYVQRVLSDRPEDLDTLKRLGSAVRMKLTGAEPEESAGSRAAAKAMEDRNQPPEPTPVGARAPVVPLTKPAAAPVSRVSNVPRRAPDPIVIEDMAVKPKRWGLLVLVLVIAAAAGVAGFYLWNYYTQASDDAVTTSARQGADGVPVVGVPAVGVAAASPAATAPKVPSTTELSETDIQEEPRNVATTAVDDADAAVASDSTLAGGGTTVMVPVGAADAGTAGAEDGTTNTDAAVVAGADTGAHEDDSTDPDAAVDSAVSVVGGAQVVDAAVVDAGVVVAELDVAESDQVVVPHNPKLIAELLQGGEMSPVPTTLPPKEAKALRDRGEGVLRVHTRPEMVLYVDGDRIGVTPRDVTLSAGSHRIELRGGPGVTRFLRPSIVAGEVSPVQESLIAGMLHFDKIADDVEVFVDGERVGLTPLDSIPIWEGQHQVRLKGANGKVATRTVTVTKRSREHHIRTTW